MVYCFSRNPQQNNHISWREASQDLLGRTYEYCIMQFAAKEGKGGGEFYTPACVVRTLVEVLRPFNNSEIMEIIPEETEEKKEEVAVHG